MKSCPFRFQGKPVLRAREFLNRADTTVIQSLGNNGSIPFSAACSMTVPPLTKHQPAIKSLRMRKHFQYGVSESLNSIKSFSDAANGLFNGSKGKRLRNGGSPRTITGKDYLTLLKLSLREYRHVVHRSRKNGRPSAGPGQRLPMVGFCLPNEKEHGMSQHAPSQFLLSG